MVQGVEASVVEATELYTDACVVQFGDGRAELAHGNEEIPLGLAIRQRLSASKQWAAELLARRSDGFEPSDLDEVVPGRAASAVGKRVGVQAAAESKALLATSGRRVRRVAAEYGETCASPDECISASPKELIDPFAQSLHCMHIGRADGAGRATLKSVHAKMAPVWWKMWPHQGKDATSHE